MRVLVLAAHPDDEVLGAGGTIAGHVDRGDTVVSVIAADGASSRYAPGAEHALAAAAHAAAAILGHEVHLLGFEDQRLDKVPLLEVTRRFEALAREVRPDVVYTHHWGDLNRDHRIVAEAAQIVCRPVGSGFPRYVYAFETPSSTEWGVPSPETAFVPNRFVDIGATVERKLQAFACYTSEVRPAPHPRSIDGLRVRAQLWGHTVACTYAEAFVVLREVV